MLMFELLLPLVALCRHIHFNGFLGSLPQHPEHTHAGKNKRQPATKAKPNM